MKTIGRSSKCDITISSDSTISRVHCKIEENKDGTFLITDLNSSNGTFINGNRITSETIKTSGYFLIGRHLIRPDGSYTDLAQQTAITVENIAKSYDGKKYAIQPTSFSIEPKTITAIMGPSGCGKSTLLKMLNGIHPATEGKVYLFGLELISNYQTIKRQIGYVPQDDTIHLDLTVYQSLYYAAKLRLKSASKRDIDTKIIELLSKLSITHIKDNLNSEISGGQRKRVCIAVELLSDPIILLLDEPTSPLDPQSIDEFMHILKSLTADKTTIVLVTHKPEDLQFMHEVIFLNASGILKYKGVADAKRYLKNFDAQSTVELYSILSKETNQTHKVNLNGAIPMMEQMGNTTSLTKGKINWLEQLKWLVLRNLKVKTNDSINTYILLLQAPIIAFLVAIIFKELTLAVVFMSMVSAIWFGVNNAAREIVKEQVIFHREYLFNLSLSSYLSSKMITLMLLAFIQSFLFLFVLWMMYNSTLVPLHSFFKAFVWMFFVVSASSALGLLVSASMRSSEKVMSVIPLLLIPQIMLAGVLTKISNALIEVISYFTLSRWATEGFTIMQKTIVVNTLKPKTTKSGELIMNSAGNVIYIEHPEKANAISRLGSKYAELYYDLFGNSANSIGLDIFFLLLLSSLSMTLAYFILRKRYQN